MGRPKNVDKDVRAPVGQQTQTNKMDDAEKARIAIGHSLRLDASHYLRMPEYQEMQLFWALSHNGEVDKCKKGEVYIFKRGQHCFQIDLKKQISHEGNAY